LGEWLEIVKKGDSKYIRCNCGNIMSKAGENWKLGAYSRVVAGSAAGPLVKLHNELEIREHACPHCARMHSVEVALKGEQSLWEVAI
ncbi:MAG: acetone carboxylase subunit gamma, partial [Dehalococcoidia bacterium]|nr:acetone carboxylase subunit gamma [Dehalococcoidia bacterium]